MALTTWDYYVTAPWTRDGWVRVQVAVIKILDLQLAELLTAQRVIEERRQNGAVALLPDGFLAG
jgi:hypothetical protein